MLMTKSSNKFCKSLIFFIFLFFMKQSTKVAVIFNEAHPEFYIKTNRSELKELDFTPFFEVEDYTPIEEYEQLAKRLTNSDFYAYSLNIKDNLYILLDDLENNKPDVIFNFVELFKDNNRLEMNIVGLFELFGIPYTGAPPMALANCQDKVFTKKLLNAAGIKTPKFHLIKNIQKNYRSDLNFPIIVKPAFEDASVGIENDSIVLNTKQLKNRVEFVLSYFAQPVLLEQYVEGRELNVAVLGDKNLEVLPISEIDFSKMPNHLFNIVSYQAKWDPLHEAYHKTIPHCPAILPPKIEKKAKEIAITAFRTMGCRDYARVDMRLDKNNELYVLEVNPNPDLTESAGFMRSAEAAGLSYEETLQKIISLALQRGKK
jgi:D-alanine-D-alanine ligase